MDPVTLRLGTTVRDNGVERDAGMVLDVSEFSVENDRVTVAYHLRNTGEIALAVFDRGDRHAVLTGRQQAGGVGVPTFEASGDGDITLRHVAVPSSRPSPTLPPTPLALKLVPGAAHESGFSFQLPTATPPKRVRWCLGVAPFDPERFFSVEQTPAGEIWQAGDEAVATQKSLCSPWFDPASGAFASGDG